jgi:hypothetical protein
MRKINASLLPADCRQPDFGYCAYRQSSAWRVNWYLSTSSNCYDTALPICGNVPIAAQQPVGAASLTRHTLVHHLFTSLFIFFLCIY